MDGFGQSGSRTDLRYGFNEGGRGAGRHNSVPGWRGGSAPRPGFSTRGNPLWTDQMEHDQTRPYVHMQEQRRWADTTSSMPSQWEQSVECHEALAKIAEITSENWIEQEYVECQWDFAEAALEVKNLQSHAMLCYFIDPAPLLQDFKDWISFECDTQRGWPTTQIKFLGKNFFMVNFENPAHRDEAIILAPWFMEHRFVYTFKWEAHFDVRLETYTQLPVWIEIPFRSLLLENCRQQVAGALG
ncbi:unnamed protein product [Calypogeia fissa]